MNTRHIFYSLGLTVLLSSCVFAAKIQIPANLKLIDDMDQISAWAAFAAPNAKVDIAQDSKDAARGKNSLSVKYTMGDWGGVGATFKDKKKWSLKDSLFFVFKGDNNGKKVRVEITDNGGERFAKDISVNFTGWKAFTIPFSELKRRADWQPNGAPKDGLTLTAVEGISFSPFEKGQGNWSIDTVGVIPASK